MEGPISFWGYKEQESNLFLPEHDDDDDEDFGTPCQYLFTNASYSFFRRPYTTFSTDSLVKQQSVHTNQDKVLSVLSSRNQVWAKNNNRMRRSTPQCNQNIQVANACNIDLLVASVYHHVAWATSRASHFRAQINVNTSFQLVPLITYYFKPVLFLLANHVFSQC